MLYLSWSVLSGLSFFSLALKDELDVMLETEKGIPFLLYLSSAEDMSVVSSFLAPSNESASGSQRHPISSWRVRTRLTLSRS